jgi:hypothetical protein
MDLVSALLLAAGALLVALGLFDALRTAIAAGGGGPLTNRLAHGLWHAALRWHRRKQQQSEGARAGRHRLLARVGPTVLIGIVLTWVVLLVAGYFLMFSADPSSVVRASGAQPPAGFFERLYFAGFSVSTLGTGDFIPNGDAARLLTVFASMSGFFMMTLTVTYAMPVISAVVAKRRLASSIAGLGLTPEEILRGAWDGESLASLEQPLVNRASEIEMHTQQHLAYPVLHVFHIAQPRAAVGPRIAALSETLRLIRHLPEEAQPPPAAMRSAQSAIDGFLRLARSSFVPPEQQHDAPDRPVVEPLRTAGLPIPPEKGTVEDDKRKGEDASQQERRRRLLRALAEDDGWTWADVVHEDPPPLP